MQAFQVKGTFKMGPYNKQPFTLMFATESEDEARERTVSELGSKHRVKRTGIKIASIEPVSNDKVTDVRVAYALGIDTSN